MSREDRRQRLIAEGRLRPAAPGPRRVKLGSMPIVKLPAGVTAQDLVDAERDEDDADKQR